MTEIRDNARDELGLRQQLEQQVEGMEQALESMDTQRQHLQARIALLEEFREAFEVVEEGLLDFDLHNDAVVRLRAAREALYRSGAAGTANVSSRAMPAAADSAAPETP